MAPVADAVGEPESDDESTSSEGADEKPVEVVTEDVGDDIVEFELSVPDVLAEARTTVRVRV